MGAMCHTLKRKMKWWIRTDEEKGEREKKRKKMEKKGGEEGRSTRRHFLRSMTKRRSKLIGAKDSSSTQ